MQERYVFIDADSLLYRACYGDVTDKVICNRYKQRLDYIKVNTFSTDMFVAIKGFDNFREKLDPNYKAHRPVQTDEMRRKLNFAAQYALELGAIQSNGWEADDQVRAWSYEADQTKTPWVISGIDKDLLQIPGTHFDYGGTDKKPLPEEKKWHWIKEQEGNYRFGCQLLTGDVVDNIKGVKGIGVKKAEKLLYGKTKKEIMTIIMGLYEKEYGQDWKAKLHTNTNLIYMRRWKDDEFFYEDWLK